MIFILNSIIFFIVSVILHIVLSRTLLFFGKKSIFLVGVFAAGGLLHFIFTFFYIVPSNNVAKTLFFLPLPFTSYLLYMLLAANYLVYLLATYTGEKSPSLIIFFLLKNGRSKTLSQIKSAFPKKEMIDMRLKSLKEGKFIKQERDRYVVLPRGEKIAYLFRLYRRILGWRSGG